MTTFPGFSWRTSVIALLFGLALAPSASRSEESLEAYQAIQPHMGTRFAFTLFAASPQQAEKALVRANARIADIEAKMSDYREESEIRQLSARAKRQKSNQREALAISQDLQIVLTASRRINRASEGAFDVSVSPLSKLWRRSKTTGEMPPADALAKAKAVLGPEHWRLTEAGILMDTGVAFDLGGIAKGYALDEALKVMKQEGVTQVLIDGGGDLVASDPPPGRKSWRIGVAPLEADGEPQWVIPLANNAAATSGDAWQYLEVGGRRYSHVINPRTGLGVEGRHSATVLAPTAMTADAWASAMCVLGPREGPKALKSEPDAEAVITTLVQGKAVQAMTDGFKTLAVKRKSTARPPTEPKQP